MSAAPDRFRRALLFGRSSSAHPLRPPWALGESDFLDRCTACGACIERCREHVLAPDAAGRAVFDPHLGECTFCGDCEQACGPRALDRDAVAVAWNQLAAIGDTCLPRRGVICTSCRDVCLTQAIAFPAMGGVPAPAVDASQCTGCGACVGICPVGAIALQRHPGEPA